MSISAIVTRLREDKTRIESELNALRTQRDTLIAQHETFIVKERELAKQIKAKQMELAPILNDLAELRREAAKASEQPA